MCALIINSLWALIFTGSIKTKLSKWWRQIFLSFLKGLFFLPIYEVASSDSGFRAVAIRFRGAHPQPPYFADIENKAEIDNLLDTYYKCPPRFLKFPMTLRYHQILASLPLIHETKKFKPLYKHECRHECYFSLSLSSLVFRSEFRYIATRTTDAQWSLFHLNPELLWLRLTNWADRFWDIWGIFGRITYQHPFWYSESLSVWPKPYFWH